MSSCSQLFSFFPPSLLTRPLAAKYSDTCSGYHCGNIGNNEGNSSHARPHSFDQSELSTRVHSWRHQDNDTSWVALKCIQYALCSRLPKNSFLFKKPNSVLYSILRLLHSFIFVFTFSCIWLALSTKGPLWGELPSWRPIQQCLFKLCIILSISYDSA